MRDVGSKRIVITGGAGFIGSNLCLHLLNLRHRVVCYDNFITGHPRNIQPLQFFDNFEFHEQDVSKPITLFGPVDAVMHLASPASPPDYLRHPIPTLKAGSLGTINALTLAADKGARFLLASTSEVYGDPLVNPQPESYWGNVNPVGPRSCYDEAKRFSEATTMAYHQYGLDTRIARIFNTYGPQMKANDGRVISNFVVQALQHKPLTVYGDGSQTRSCAFVSDTVDGLTKLLFAEGEDIHLPINIGNPDERTVLEIARLVVDILGPGGIEHRPLPADDPKVRRPDITRAQKVLEWSPVVSLEDGLVKTIEYFRSIL